MDGLDRYLERKYLRRVRHDAKYRMRIRGSRLKELVSEFGLDHLLKGDDPLLKISGSILSTPAANSCTHARGVVMPIRPLALKWGTVFAVGAPSSFSIRGAVSRYQDH